MPVLCYMVVSVCFALSIHQLIDEGELYVGSVSELVRKSNPLNIAVLSDYYVLSVHSSDTLLLLISSLMPRRPHKNFRQLCSSFT